MNNGKDQKSGDSLPRHMVELKAELKGTKYLGFLGEAMSVQSLGME